MKKKIITLMLVLSGITVVSASCPNGGQECCSNAFWAAHAGLMSSGWDYNSAYDFLLPSFHACLYGGQNEK